MSKSFIIAFDPEVLLPDGMARELFRGNEHYYHALGFLASTIRDYESGLSIYRGDDIDETVEEWFSSYMDTHSCEYMQDHQPVMMQKATHMHNLLPDGIFERLDIHEIRSRGVFFSGIIHDVDYR